MTAHLAARATHDQLLAAIDECLGDDDPKVRREALRVARDCHQDARAHLAHLRSLGVTDEARLAGAKADIQDFRSRYL